MSKNRNGGADDIFPFRGGVCVTVNIETMIGEGDGDQGIFDRLFLKGDAVDPDFGEFLTMSAFAAIVLNLFIFENKNLLSALMTENGRRDAGAFNGRTADLDVRIGFDEKGLSEFNGCADVAIDAVYDEDIALFDTELFSRKVDDSVLIFCCFSFYVHKAKTIRGERGKCKGERFKRKMKDFPLSSFRFPLYLLSMSTTETHHTGLTPLQKGLLGALAALYLILLIFWVANNMNKPIFGVGAVEGFYRMAQPVAAEAPMTWVYAPGYAPLAVLHEINPQASVSKITVLEKLMSGANGAEVYRASYLSDSVVVYGILGRPAVRPAPAIVVCHPSDSPYQTGLHTQDSVRFLAELGVIAFAPDYRGWGPSGGARGNEVRDVWNALATLRADPDVNATKIGLLGFSMGGGIAARAVAADTAIALLALYYPQMQGSLDELYGAMEFSQFDPGSQGIRRFIEEGKKAGADERELEYTLRMISPIYHLGGFKGRTALFHGAKDDIVSVRQSEALERELRAAGSTVGLWVYDEASHAFANSIENVSKQQLETVVREALLR